MAFTPVPNVDTTQQKTLRITEIFHSLQGESTRVGLPTVFLRLTGCPLRCGYCDTTYAFTEGSSMTLDAILTQVNAFHTPYICVTGGEPLAQKNCPDLLRMLCDAGYSVSLETSGALPIDTVDARVSRIVDIKTPGSGEEAKNHWENLSHLRNIDEVKFVLCNAEDYQWAKQILQQHDLAQTCPVLFSPVHGQLEAAQLAEWILRDQLPVRLQVQLHKYLWGNQRAR